VASVCDCHVCCCPVLDDCGIRYTAFTGTVVPPYVHICKTYRSCVKLRIILNAIYIHVTYINTVKFK
jgi:hypothetical protein